MGKFSYIYNEWLWCHSVDMLQYGKLLFRFSQCVVVDAIFLVLCKKKPFGTIAILGKLESQRKRRMLSLQSAIRVYTCNGKEDRTCEVVMISMMYS